MVTTTQNSGRPWSIPVTVGDIPDAGSRYELAADAVTRGAIAQMVGLRALSRFEAAFDLTRRGEAVEVRGEIKALVEQDCVVTLEPVKNMVAEAVDLLFAPAVEETGPAAAMKRKKKKIEPPEPLNDGVIDLAAVAIEFLVLGLDPYPRKDGAEFVRPAEANESPHPFAALAELKKQS